MVSRNGRLTDGSDKGTRFQEVEFSRSIDIPPEYTARRFPAYFKVPGGRLKIAVSLPIARRRIDIRQRGHFYYPLKAPASSTGCALSVSAPFELNTDRSGINDHVWNDWLMDQAVEFTIDLLQADWFARFGADAFKAIIGNGTANPDCFVSKIAKRLSGDACWPTRGKGEEHLAAASEIVLPTEAAFDGFLSDKRYLDPVLAGDKAVCNLATASGARSFSLSSLVRLRCAGEDFEGAPDQGRCRRQFLLYQLQSQPHRARSAKTPGRSAIGVSPSAHQAAQVRYPEHGFDAERDR